MKLKVLGLTLIAAAAIFAPAAIDAQGRHPRYLHARTDLRSAQFFARVREEPNVTRHLQVAVNEMEAAIREIDHAAVLDARDLEDHPPIDTNLARQDRFRKILDLLRSSRADIGREEDNPRAREWRNVAFRHIDAAIESVRRAAKEARIDHELGF
jgi:hypothetical protein